jgi:ABC-2 type transport system ATP-binding protein
VTIELDLETVAELVDVHKSFGQIHALRGVDLQVCRGEILALLGPNGAGKTTAIGILLGRRTPDRGRVALLGRDPRLPSSRSRIGAALQETGLPPNLTVTEVTDLVRAHFEHPRSTEDLLAQVGLTDLRDRQTGGLSGGQKRRFAVALSFAGNPEVAFLDEPTSGLDVASRQSLWQAIRSYRDGGGTVLLTTHYLEEAEALASRVSVIARGQIVAHGSVDEIKAHARLKRVQFKAPFLPHLTQIACIEQVNGLYTLYTPDPDQLVRDLIKCRVPFHSLEVSQASLEEAFLALTEDAI